MPRPIYPPKRKLMVLTQQDAGRGPRAEPEICFVKEEKSLFSSGNRAPDRPGRHLLIILPMQCHS